MDALLVLPVAFEQRAVPPGHVVAEHGAPEPAFRVLLLVKHPHTCIYDSTYSLQGASIGLVAELQLPFSAKQASSTV